MPSNIRSGKPSQCGMGVYELPMMSVTVTFEGPNIMIGVLTVPTQNGRQLEGLLCNLHTLVPICNTFRCDLDDLIFAT